MDHIKILNLKFASIITNFEVRRIDLYIYNSDYTELIIDSIELLSKKLKPFVERNYNIGDKELFSIFVGYNEEIGTSELEIHYDILVAPYIEMLYPYAEESNILNLLYSIIDDLLNGSFLNNKLLEVSDLEASLVSDLEDEERAKNYFNWQDGVLEYYSELAGDTYTDQESDDSYTPSSELEDYIEYLKPYIDFIIDL